MSVSADQRLAGVRAKIERAKQHIIDLNRELTAFAENNRNCVRREKDPATGEIVQRVHYAHPLPDCLPLIIGDAAHNLRSALDHLAWQLVEANGQAPTPKTAYPIHDRAEDFQKSSRQRLGGMGPPAQRLIEQTQPYHTGYELLGKLSHVDNFDKHRLLIVAAIRVGGFGFALDLGAVRAKFMLVPDSGAHTAELRLSSRAVAEHAGGAPIFMEQGAELGRIQPTGGIEDSAFVAFTPLVAFKAPGEVSGEPVLAFLSGTTQLVETVVSQFVPFL